MKKMIFNKKMKNREKRTFMEAHTATKIMQVIVLLSLFSLFLVGTVSAWEFDNIGLYDEGTKTMDIRNAFALPIIGDSIAEVQLIRNTDICVYHCEAIMKVTLKEDYKDPLNELIFKDGNIKNYEMLFVEFEKYEVNVNDYEQGNCNLLINGTETCSEILVGSHKETRTKEIEKQIYDYQNKELKAGVYYLKLKGEKNPEQSIEWIPTYMGVDIKQWAWWQGAIPTFYWKLNEPSGDFRYNASDEMEVRNLTNSNAATFVTGKLYNAVEFNGTLNRGLHNQSDDRWDILINGNFTILFWINTTEAGTWDAIMGGGDDESWGVDEKGWHITHQAGSDVGKIKIETRDGTSAICNCSINTGEWYRIVIVREGGGATETKIYVNGAINNTGTLGPYMLDLSYFGLGYGAGYSWNENNFNGLLDDIAIYNGTIWDAADVLTDWNNGNGIELDLISAVNVTHHSPANLYNETETNTIDFQCNSTVTGDVLVLGNSSILIYDNFGVRQVWQSVNIAGTYNITNHSVTLPFGVYNWSCITNATDNGNTSYSGNRTVYFSFPEFSLTTILNYPDNAINLTNSSLEFGANFSVIKGNMTNATLYIWKSDGSLFGTNFSEITAGNNETNMSISNLVFSEYLWNVFGCGASSTNSTCGFTGSNRTFSIQTNLDAEYYETDVYETSYQPFQINITIPESSIFYDAQLIYNQTSYTGTITDLGNDKYSIIKSIYIPQISAHINISFYWNLLYEEFSENTTTHNQTILPLVTINITTENCSEGFFEAINYTFIEELNLTSLNADIKYNFKYGVGNLSLKTNYGETNNTDILRVCINQSFDNYKLGYGEIEYQSTGHVSRRYYMFEGHELSNSITESYILHDLKDADSTSFVFEIKNTFLNPYKNKYVALLRWYPQLNEYRIVEMGKTDEEGKTIMKVEVEDADYRIGVYELNGSLIKLAEAIRMACLVSPCTYSLKIIQEVIDYFGIYNIESSLVFETATNRFVYIWNDPSQQTESMRLITAKETGYQEIIICNSTGSGYTGVLSCDIENYTGVITAKAFRTSSPELIISSLTKTIRTVWNNNIGLFIAFIFSLIVGFAAIIHPAAGILMSIVGLIPAVSFGSITLAIFIAIAVLGGIIIHVMKRAR